MRQRDYIIIAPAPLGPSVAKVKSIVADHYGISEIDMVTERQDRASCRPRQVAMFLCKRLTTQSLPAIGRRFGGRDHTTIMHGIKVIERLRLIDADIAADIEALTDRLAA